VQFSLMISDSSTPHGDVYGLYVENRMPDKRGNVLIKPATLKAMLLLS